MIGARRWQRVTLSTLWMLALAGCNAESGDHVTKIESSAGNAGLADDSTVVPGAALHEHSSVPETPSFPSDEGWIAATGGSRFGVYFRPLGDRIPRNEDFSLEVAILDAGAPASNVELIMWGDMPAHGHGLVRQPIVAPLAEGRFRVDAMILHMRGHWEMTFEVLADGTSEVLTHEIDL